MICGLLCANRANEMQYVSDAICGVACVGDQVRCLQVTAIAYDNPIPGFDTNNTINLRLWAAKPGQEFDLEAFNTGDYVQVCVQSCQLSYLWTLSFCSWGWCTPEKARTVKMHQDYLHSLACITVSCTARRMITLGQCWR